MAGCGSETIIPDHVIARWQSFVDAISTMASAPSAMINRLDPPDLEVFRSSIGPDNPFPAGVRMPLLGIYCEAAAKRRQMVRVTDARKNAEWADSPTAKAGIYAYLGYPLFWPDGNVFGTLCVVDTKENSWGENIERLVGVFRDAIEAHLALVHANEAVKSANHAKSEFLANMSHEIRTPMTAILGFSSILMESCLDEQQCDAVATIQRNGEYLLRLINEILDLSKIEAGKLDLEHIECSPCSVLHDVVSLMSNRADAKGLTIAVEYVGLVPRTIHSDPTRLRQILINLLGNAVKFTHAGTICLMVRLVDRNSLQPQIRFDIIDTGIGMTEEQVAKLFEPFSQAEKSTTREHGGTGLGLAICKRLAIKLGGNIAVESVFGKGSVFSVTVPTGPLDGVDMVRCPMESVTPAKIDQPKTLKTRLDCRVLLVEDGPDNQRLITHLLGTAGAEITVVDNGQCACDAVFKACEEGRPFDIVLMDMQMPVMDGYEATSKLRECGYEGPVIAITAYAMESDRAQTLHAGCDDYLSKPIDRDRLISLIAQYVPRRIVAVV